MEALALIELIGTLARLGLLAAPDSEEARLAGIHLKALLDTLAKLVAGDISTDDLLLKTYAEGLADFKAKAGLAPTDVPV